MKIDIIFPVLNEENRLENGIIKTLEYLKTSKFNDFKLTIVDNGSTDKTEEIGLKLCEKNSQVKYIRIEEKGVGVAFREGVKHTNFEIVGYMDIDLSTDLESIDEVFRIFFNNLNIDIITGSRNMKESEVKNRPLVREITSKSLGKIINIILKTKLKDYMCGFKFFRREKLNEIMLNISDEKGWFYCAELLIYSEWKNYIIYELPVKWTDERENSKVDNQIFSLINKYMKQIFRLAKMKKEKKL
jgi:hypothetical protein